MATQDDEGCWGSSVGYMNGNFPVKSSGHDGCRKSLQRAADLHSKSFILQIVLGT